MQIQPVELRSLVILQSSFEAVSAPSLLFCEHDVAVHASSKKMPTNESDRAKNHQHN